MTCVLLCRVRHQDQKLRRGISRYLLRLIIALSRQPVELPEHE